MSKLRYKTIANERPQGKPNVYFSCHPDDLETFFEAYSSKILKIQDCAIWYEAEPEAPYDTEDLELHLSQMQLFVMPVTTKLLTKPNRAMDVEFPFAVQKHIPVLPLMTEPGLDDIFTGRFGDLQYIDPNNADPSKRSFDELLESYLRSVLVSNELAEKVRAAFDAYIFLSYRKKDRKMAQELMRLIHRNPVCRNIAIWYDEFLTPGEDFNQAIEEMLKKSDLFALAVTPNLVNEPNYVMTTEYPAALAQKKPVLPVEMIETDRSALEEHYEALPSCVQGKDGEKFRSALLDKLKSLAITANDADPGHNYLIGLAYLDGIDVEVDSEKAVSLITGAAEAGVQEAMSQLVTMYETGKGVSRDYHKGIEWRKKHIDLLRKAYEADHTEEKASDLIKALWALGNAQYDLYLLDDAETAYYEMHSLIARLAEIDKTNHLDDLSVSYSRLGVIAEAKGNRPAAQEYYKKGLDINKTLANESKTAESRRRLSISYHHLGSLAEDAGELSEAEEYYKKSLLIRKELAEEMQTVRSGAELAVIYMRLGGVEENRGDLSCATEYYKKGLEIFETTASETETAEARQNVAHCYVRLGRISELAGKLEEAGSYYTNSMTIRRRLAEETGTIDDRFNLADSYFNLGNLAKNRRELSEAQKYFENCLEIISGLSDEIGEEFVLKDLIFLYNSFGDIAREYGELEHAQEFYEKGLRIQEKLYEKAGSDADISGLGFGYINLGQLMELKKDMTGAKEYFKKGLVISEGMVRKFNTVELQRDLRICYSELGDIARDEGNLSEAMEYCNKEIAIQKKLSEDIGSIDENRRLSSGYVKMGILANAGGDPGTAQQYFEEAFALSKRLADETGTTETYRDLSNICVVLGIFYKNTHDLLKSREYFRYVINIAKTSDDEALQKISKTAQEMLM